MLSNKHPSYSLVKFQNKSMFIYFLSSIISSTQQKQDQFKSVIHSNIDNISFDCCYTIFGIMIDDFCELNRIPFKVVTWPPGFVFGTLWYIAILHMSAIFIQIVAPWA